MSPNEIQSLAHSIIMSNNSSFLQFFLFPISSELVRFSSELVRFSSELVGFPSELVRFSSELVRFSSVFN